ncbi:MAG: glycerol-3-phosphate dehydrogenase, partial [Pseudomonadota bacterium]
RIADTPNPNSMRMVKGSHIIVPRMYTSNEAYILQNEDDRIVFVIPYEDDFTLIGTTDENFKGDPASAAIGSTETDYLINITNTYFKTKLTTDDIVHSYSGVRPLLEEANASAQELTRDYKVEVHGTSSTPSLVNVFGGKITTYRKLSEFATNKVMSLFNSDAKPWTKEVALPGGDFTNKDELTAKLYAEYPWLPTNLVARFVRQYGTLCLNFIKDKDSLLALGQHFGHALYQAEVDYLIEHEWAMTVEDVLWRRTKMGLRLDNAQKDALRSYIASVSQKDSAQSVQVDKDTKETACRSADSCEM